MATTPIPANCQAVTDALLTESGRLGGRMYRRVAQSRPIIQLQTTTRGAWMNGMGFSYNAVTFERSFAPLTGDPWTTIVASDGDSSNACRPPTDTVNFGQTSRAVTPRHYAVNTQDFCIRDISMGWQYAEFMGLVTRALVDIPQWVWARRFTQDYYTVAGHHLTLSRTVDSTQDSSSGYNTSNLPTAPLSLGVLNEVKLNLYREGGDNPTGTDEMTGEPVFTAIISSEAFEALIRDNPNLRQDVRYAFMGEGYEAPTAPGVKVAKKQTYGGWDFRIDPYPRRFVFNGSAYVEIAPFVQTAATQGYAWELNTAWLNAPYEEYIIWHADNYQDLVVNTAENTPANWQFTPRDWMGSFSVRNILDRTCNQDGTMIYFRALFASAARPINPRVGWTILAQRCGLPTDLHSCQSSG